MTRELHIKFSEFISNVAAVFDRIARNGETVVVEREGAEVALIRPVAAARAGRRRRELSAEDRAAFLSAAGGWKDLVDTEKLKRDTATSRALSTRSPVEL